MARFIIQGGRRLGGRHAVPGNKNAALPMLAACVLTDKPVRLQNIPLIEDVRTMLAILEDLGVRVSLRGRTVELCASGLRKTALDASLCRKVRSSILFAGPLAARMGRATIPPPGGDIIGRRRLDTHFDGLREIGISAASASSGRAYSFRARHLTGADILLDEASVTATENILMAAVRAEGRTTVFNAACEPHVQDLCEMLNKMGARISGIGTNRLLIEGVSELGGVTHRVSPDYVDAAGFLAAAALTGGELSINAEDCPECHMAVIAKPFAKMGIILARDTGGTLRFRPAGRLKIRNDFGAAVPKIEDGPWPGFPSDLMSVAIVAATQARGTMLFFEKMFESRMYFVDRLIEMGARIVQCDPHRVIATGPAALRGSHLSSPDIRAGMALIIAALCARGESIIDNAQVVDRGYEKIDSRLRALGADITRVE